MLAIVIIILVDCVVRMLASHLSTKWLKCDAPVSIRFIDYVAKMLAPTSITLVNIVAITLASL